MLMDLLRIENFMKDHACHVDDKAAKLNDMVVYADFVKGKYQSVFEQLQVDIEVEKAYDALEDVLFIEDEDKDLVLASPYKFTAGGRTYSYAAGTPRESIWTAMFALYSDGANLTIHSDYDDISAESGQDEVMEEISYEDIKTGLENGLIKISDSLEDYGVTGIGCKIGSNAFYLPGSEEYETAQDFLRDYDTDKIADMLYSVLATCRFAMCSGLNEYEYIEYKNILKANSKTAVIQKFCNGTIAIKVCSQEELNALIRLIRIVADKVDCDYYYESGYKEEFPYFYVNRSNDLAAVRDMVFFTRMKNGRISVTEYVEFKDIMYIPEDILSKFTKGEIAFRIHNDVQYKIILNNIQKFTDIDVEEMVEYEYDKNFSYIFVNKNNELNAVRDMKYLVHNVIADIHEYVDFSSSKIIKFD